MMEALYALGGFFIGLFMGVMIGRIYERTHYLVALGQKLADTQRNGFGDHGTKHGSAGT